MTADMLSNIKIKKMVTELFISGRKLNISFVFITESYFAVPKNIRLHAIHCVVTKIPNKRELQVQIVYNHSSDIVSDNPSHFRKDLLERIWKLIMTIDHKIRDEKLQYDINREAAKTSALSISKISALKYLSYSWRNTTFWAKNSDGTS